MEWKEETKIFPCPDVDSGMRLEENLSRVVVSHKVQTKISGALHDETFYGTKNKSKVNQMVNYKILLRRVDHQMFFQQVPTQKSC